MRTNKHDPQYAHYGKFFVVQREGVILHPGQPIVSQANFDAYVSNYGEDYEIRDAPLGDIRDAYGNQRYEYDGSAFVLRAAADLLADAQAGALAVLRRAYAAALERSDHHEQKAKTLLLDHLASGESGDPPQYWTDWKSERDAIDTQYQSEKAAIMAETDPSKLQDVSYSLV